MCGYSAEWRFAFNRAPRSLPSTVMKPDPSDLAAALDQAADVAQLQLLQRQLAERSRQHTQTGRHLAALRAKLDQALVDIAARSTRSK